MHAHRFSRNLVSGLLVFSASFALGCDDTVSGPTPVTTGSLRVNIGVFGTMPDLDGYLVGVSTDGQSDPASRTVDAAGGSAFFRDLSLGTHSVRLESLAANCSVDGDNPLASTVVAEKTTLVRLAVLCPASLSTQIFTHVSGDASAFAKRYFLEEDGTFALDFGRTHTSSAEWIATYTRDDMTFVFDFGTGDFGELLEATGTLAGDCLTIDYNDALQSYSFTGSTDFVDGEYCRS